MKIVDALDFASIQLMRNLRRSAVAALGLLVGVAALVSLETLGRATSYYLTTFIEDIGKVKVIRVRAENTKALGSSARSFRFENLERVRTEYPFVAGVTASVTDWQAQAVYRERVYGVRISGMDRWYLDLFNLEVDKGRRFSTEDEDRRAAVAIVGSEVASRLFSDTDPVGKVVVAEGVPVVVVGVLASSSFDEWNNTVFVPLASALSRFHDCRNLDAFDVVANDLENVRVLAARLRRDVAGWDPSGLGRYAVSVNDSALDRVGDSLLILRTFVVVVGLVTLVLGGIGIMNVFYVLVSERSAEIGIRKAVGATEAEIAIQVLTEAALLCLAASSAGVVFGYLVVNAVVVVTGETDLAAMSIARALGAVALASAAGVMFSVAPALMAARRDAVDAIRHR